MADVAAGRAERAAATTANAAPLGLSAFALTTFVLSAFNAGLYKGPFIVIGLAVFYGGIVQIIAGIQAFRNGNTFQATAFCSYGGFWLAVGATLMGFFGILAGYGGVTAAFHAAFAWFLLGWTIFTLFMFLATLRTTMVSIAVFGLLFLTFLLLTLGEFGVGTTVLGGYLGILTALVAWYDAAAQVLAAGRAMFSLPVGPRS
jgi:succinate-acetate transporter protein